MLADSFFSVMDSFYFLCAFYPEPVIAPWEKKIVPWIFGELAVTLSMLYSIVLFSVGSFNSQLMQPKEQS